LTDQDKLFIDREDSATKTNLNLKLITIAINKASPNYSESRVLVGRMRDRRSIPSISLPSVSILVSTRLKKRRNVLEQEQQLPQIPNPSL
jgi:hypothetical protein